MKPSAAAVERARGGKTFDNRVYRTRECSLQVESEKFGCWWSLWMFYEFCIRFVHLNRWQTNGKLRNASVLCCLNKPIESEKLGASKSRCTTTQNNSHNFPPKQHDEGKVALWITCSACQERAKPEEDFLVTTDGTCFDIIWLHDYQAPTSNGRKGKVIVESCLSLEGSPHFFPVAKRNNICLSPLPDRPCAADARLDTKESAKVSHYRVISIIRF